PEPNQGLWDQATVDEFAKVDFNASKMWFGANASRVTRTPIWADAGHDPVWNVRFSPDGGEVAGAAEDGRVSGFDAATGAPRFALAPPAKTKLMGMDWSPDGSRIAAGGADKNVYVFDANTKTMIDTLTGHADGVTSLAWSRDGCMLAGAAGGRLVNLMEN